MNPKEEQDIDKQLPMKELAWACGISRQYLSIMRRAGLVLINRRGSVRQVREFRRKSHICFRDEKRLPLLKDRPSIPEEKIIINTPRNKKKQ